MTNAIETTTATVLTLIKRPVTSADFKNNAEFLFTAATKASVQYNEALAAYQRSVELEGVGAGTSVTFNEGKGDKAEVLVGQVLAKLEDGKYQILVQFAGAPAKLLNVKPSDLIAINKPAAAAPVEPELHDGDAGGGTNDVSHVG